MGLSRNRILDLTGKKFGKLTVVSFLKREKNHTYWVCKCECGNEKIVSTNSLRKGDTIGCGCSVGKSIKHGDTKNGIRTPEYTAWNNIKVRCTQPNSKYYPYYGGRGVGIFSEWLGENGFENFISYVGRRPSSKHSLDRWPNKNGNYEPGNVRWATKKEQANNVRDNRLVFYKGECKTASEWCGDLSLNYKTVFPRLLKGYTADEAFNKPLSMPIKKYREIKAPIVRYAFGIIN